MNIAEINAQFPFVFDALFFCLGACVGSFLNVCIYRIPEGKSIIRPASHCACGKPIAWHDNIPVLGWFLLRGRARCCKRKISFRYPLVELLTALIFMGMWILLPPPNAFAGMLFAAILIFCAFVDIDHMMLPDFATAGGAAIGFAVSIFVPQLHGAQIENAPWLASAVASGICSVIGIIVGSGVLYWIRLGGEYAFGREAMGEGDVILMGCIGAFCGWQGALFAIFAGSLLGALIMLPAAIAGGYFSKKTRTPDEDAAGENAEDVGAIPFGPWLALGGLLYYMFFADITSAYFNGISQLLFG